MRSKLALLVSLCLATYLTGCASGGKKAPKGPEDPSFNNILVDTTDNFLSRYERFITGKERKAFKKLKTTEEQTAFVTEFWAKRDTDPATPENEFKNLVDERIDDIATERFRSTTETAGLMFRNHEGVRGDVAWVYLLHGLPDAIGQLSGNSFSDLMLWVYMEPEGDKILYAFLFYQKGGNAAYRLFTQEMYQMDPCGALYELSKFNMYSYVKGSMHGCPPEIARVYEEVRMASPHNGNVNGYLFAWSIFNFSHDPTLRQGDALQPPETASVVAKNSNARVVGEAPKPQELGTEILASACETCNSMIRAELQLEHGLEALMTFRTGDIDWQVQGDQVSYALKARIVFERGGEVRTFEKSFVIESQKAYVVGESQKEVRLAQELLEPHELESLPSGTYRVSVYVRNTFTHKYTAWETSYSKP